MFNVSKKNYIQKTLLVENSNQLKIVVKCQII